MSVPTPPLIPGSAKLADEYVQHLRVSTLTTDNPGVITGTTLTDGTFSTTGGVVTGATIIAASDNVAANSLKTTGAVVNVSAAAPPSVGQTLVATSATTATWQTGSSTSPAAPVNSVQYNNAGSFGGNAGLTTDGTSLTATAGLTAGTTVTAGTGVTATTGNVTASAGNIVATSGSVTAGTSVVAGTTVTAGTGVTATTGGVTASAGNVTATLGSVVGVGHVYSSKAAYTQSTSTATAVPITTNAGTVTLFTSTLATASSVSFNLTGAVILSGSQIMITKVSYTGVPFTNGVPEISVNNTTLTAGTASVTVANYGATALAGVLAFSYIIV